VRVSLRPSKITLFEQLESDLAGMDGEVGVDAASAAFKSYPYFRTRSYYGVDIDKSALQQGLHDHPEGIALLADVTDLDLPSGSVDVCVSTNTLNWFGHDKRLQALAELTRIVAPHGWLVLELDCDRLLPEALVLLRARFEVVEVCYYGNRLCQAYESRLVSWVDVNRRARGLVGTVLLGLARIVSLTDRMSASAKGRTHAYVRCHWRSDDTEPASFVVDESLKVADGMYALNGSGDDRPQQSVRPATAGP